MLEKETFLQWRRELAAVEATHDDKRITPFEKNLEVWRQLWRCVEKSDVLVQIVDARNPLFYHSPDLDVYAGEQDALNPKRTLLIMNKADYLTQHQRTVWKDYLNERGIEFIFFSAKIAQNQLDRAAGILDEDEVHQHNSDVGGSFSAAVDSEAQDAAAGGEGAGDTLSGIGSRILGRDELLDFLRDFAHEQKRINAKANGLSEEELDEILAAQTAVGMIGYPNVGKSSIINVLIGASKKTHGTGARVSVSSTPGHTKHLQTLVISDTIMLCDCPGLVFPSFSSSAGEMVCSGVLPVSQLRDSTPALDLVCKRVPRQALNKMFRIALKNEGTEGVLGMRATAPPTALDLANQHALERGWMAAGCKGRPDDQKAGRNILKDFQTGKLLYCHPPPDIQLEQQQDYIAECYPGVPSLFAGREDVEAYEAEQAAAKGGNKGGGQRTMFNGRDNEVAVVAVVAVACGGSCRRCRRCRRCCRCRRCRSCRNFRVGVVVVPCSGFGSRCGGWLPMLGAL